MDKWVLGIYLFFAISILAGLVFCWRAELPFSQKALWSAMIIIFPFAGTVFYFTFADKAKDVLS